jgi:adenylosuccinate synthase
MLDIDHGTYPMVSSSSTTTGGVCTGLGIPPSRIADVFGIFKAYSTRVGSGPFPVELFDSTGDRIREIGHEYGAVTGRNRRCGWLDLVALKYAVQVNGVTQLIMMKSDVLDEFPAIKVCTAYRSLTADRSTLTEVPYDLGGCEAVYEELPGWHTDITGATSYDQLPQALRDYVKFIEDYIGIPVTIVSVGPDRNATIVRS